MFYRPEDGHGLPHNPFNAIVSPRPIGWISSRDGQGRDNLAPYSFFNAVAYVPPQVMFASTSAKEDVMNVTSAPLPHGEDEFARAGIDKAECEQIACARVANAPASLECKLTQIVQLPGEANFAVFGEVVGVHMRDDCVVDGRFDVTRFQPLSRLGYRDYTVVRDVFELKRPDD